MLDITIAKRVREHEPGMLPIKIDLEDWARCHSHQNFIGQVTCLLAEKISILNRTYAMAAFLKGGRYWARLEFGRESFYRDVPVSIDYIRRPVNESDFCLAVTEFIDYMDCWRKHDDTTKAGRVSDFGSVSSYKRDLIAYFKLTPRSLTGYYSKLP